MSPQKSFTLNLRINAFILLSVILNVSLVICDPCNEFKTCGRCIGQPLKCVWCSEKNHKGPRCLSQSVRSPCETYNPETELPIVEKDAQFMTVVDNKTIQFKPQEITVTVRVGDPVSFNISYKPAKHYPLDVYYLIDGTYTMKEHKSTLVSRADDIYRALKNKTNNVRFGVGSFVEKPALPFADPTLPAYSFKNYLSLTDDIDQFVKVVKDIKMTGNFDIPESGLDALMQVMVCKEINWSSNEARRIIILSTDSPYHSAGDGKIAGTTRPNDMKCHLTGGKYDKIQALTFDYPSVSQINKIASEKQIKIMFAVVEAAKYSATEPKDVYDALSTKITGSDSVKLTEDLVEMIETGYLKLVQDLKISTSLIPSMKLTLDPPCDIRICNVTHNKSLDMVATLKVTSCPSEDEFIHYLKIGPSSLKERLTVKVTAYCQCDCEKDGQRKLNSAMCNHAGTYQCGVCKCNDNRYGETCQCEGGSTEELDLKKCKMNKNDTEPCSGRGQCKCGGKCVCDTDIYGLYCQFGKYNCQFFDNKLCGGNGKCVNNTCVCDNGWTGDACNCTADKSLCFGPNSKICSGKGECVCGQCQCTALDSKKHIYTGPYCNWCHDCQDERCKELGPFVACYHSNEQSNTTNKCDKESSHTSTYHVKILNKNSSEFQTLDSFKCDKILEDGSKIIFMYADRSNSTLILIQKQKVIPPVANIWIAVGSSIGVVLLIGLLTVLAWKIMIDIRDAREYENFSKRKAAEGFDVGLNMNPTYQSPTVRFSNPAYSKEHY